MGAQNLIIDKKPAVFNSSPILEFADGRLHFVCGLYATHDSGLVVFLPLKLAEAIGAYQGSDVSIYHRVDGKKLLATVAGVLNGPFLQVSKPVLDFFGLGLREPAHVFEVNIFPL